MASEPIVLGDSFFLSKSNPTATVEQRDLDTLLLQVLQMPAVQRAKEMARQRYRTLVGNQANEEAWSRFNDEMFDEYAVRYVQVAVNSDPNYPKVMGTLHTGPHEWFGLKIPGGRSGEGDGPDTHYCMMPIGWGAEYEICGRRFHPTVADKSFALVADFGITSTTGFLPAQDLQVADDDTFVITLGPQPAASRVNHIQTTPDTHFLLVRNNRTDWRQIPDAYRIRRITPPDARPLTLEQIAQRAAWYILYDVANNYMLNRYMTTIPRNEIQGPFKATQMGGLESQRAAIGYLQLADDEAFVLTVSGNVPYHSVTLYDFWFRSFEYWKHTSNLNIGQVIPNEDGTITYVISLQDPGVHNWLDPAGYHEPVLWIRWQGRNWATDESPRAKAERVPLSELERALPAGTRRVTSVERQRQLADRQEAFRSRFLV